MYLSLLLLNPASRPAMQDLVDAQRLHVTLMKALPDIVDPAARATAKLLFRVEGESTPQPTLIVQSAVRPEWSALPVGYLSAAPRVKDIAPALDAIRAGQRLRFRLRANPTKRLVTDDWRGQAGPSGGGPKAKAGRRVALLKESERLAWLARKGAGAGVTIESADIRPEADLHGWKPGDQRLTLGSCVFDGVLVVTDAELLRSALLAGIGSGKAYGFGLLSVAPCR